MGINRWFDFFAIRDLAIITSYLFLFVLWFRASSTLADLSLLVLTISMIVEATTEGVGEEINLFGSQGILESTLAFPIGVVTLYFLHHRQWGRALLAGIVLFLAFKRITFAAILVAIAFDFAMTRFGFKERMRSVAFLAVFALSLVALFSAQIFEYAAMSLNIQNTSANSISLGRYEVAVRIWSELIYRSASEWLIGSGPGSVDAYVTAKSELNNPHNDWLKIAYDYGAIGFLVVHAILYRVFNEHRLGLMLYIYTAIVMMTDNIFIYLFYHPFVVLMISAGRREIKPSEAS